ncbi:DUF5133 domain-containing protein [Streptomyces sp. NRRL B-1347]|uniref:DUF5133 domain-containing protein n=1 Tax=Streptomyces sp. NRRL B-1347 TaxID=1476877 RepID=UPI000B12BE8A|nr:DUF5133 domain-containing protein [Streptomyces sp. NRRL B-1347]
MDTVLMPDPKALRVLLARYAELRIAAPPTEATRRALADVSYTLCVLTGVNRVDDALDVADTLLAVPGGGEGRGRAASVPAEAPGVPAARRTAPTPTPAPTPAS